MSQNIPSDAELTRFLDPFLNMQGGLLEALIAYNARYGFITADAIPHIADAFNLSRADVYGVISFYHDLRQEPPGEHIVKICQAEACQAMGSRDLTEHAESTLGATLHDTDSSGTYTVEPVYCLGNCACSPAMMIDNKTYGRVTRDRFDQIVSSLKKGASS